MNKTPELPSLKALQDAVRAADARLQPHIVETPLRRARGLGRKVGSRVWLKCEHLQHTGSFKLRGAMNKLLCLSDEERARGVVTASSGNHGIAVAHACQRLQTKAVVFVPEGAVAEKIDVIAVLGAELQQFGRDCAQTETHAREFAHTHGLTFISPYNDIEVIAGQGSIAWELFRQARTLDIVYVAVGGGGLISGLGAGLRVLWPAAELVACSPAASAVMVESLKAGRVLDLPSSPTWSDGTAGGLEQGTITFPLCQQVVGRSIQVDEPAILEGVRVLNQELDSSVEGAAGVAAAAMMQDEERSADARIGLIVCGGNASKELTAAL
jgi:threonine dehydratase